MKKINLPEISRTWYTLNWWNNLPEDGKMPAKNLRISPKWLTGSYTISFNTNGWTTVDSITGEVWI